MLAYNSVYNHRLHISRRRMHDNCGDWIMLNSADHRGTQRIEDDDIRQLALRKTSDLISHLRRSSPLDCSEVECLFDSVFHTTWCLSGIKDALVPIAAR